MVSFTDEHIVIKVSVSDPLEEVDYLRDALIDALQNRQVDISTDAERYNRTTFYLFELLRNLLPASAA